MQPRRLILLASLAVPVLLAPMVSGSDVTDPGVAPISSPAPDTEQVPGSTEPESGTAETSPSTSEVAADPTAPDRAEPSTSSPDEMPATTAVAELPPNTATSDTADGWIDIVEEVAEKRNAPLASQRMPAVAIPKFERFQQTAADARIERSDGPVPAAQRRIISDAEVLRSLLGVAMAEHILGGFDEWADDFARAVADERNRLTSELDRGESIAAWVDDAPVVFDSRFSDAARSALPPIADRDHLAFPVLGPMWFGNSWGDCRGENCERQHVGTDIIGVRMQPVRAAVDGVIESARPSAGSGISGSGVTIVAADGYRYHYFHLNNDTPGTDDGAASAHWSLPPQVTVGTRVSAGQIIGYLGDSGNSEHSVAHLHFEIRDRTGAPVPSFPLLVEAAERESCNVGIGPWSVLDIDPSPVADAAPGDRPVSNVTVRPGALSGHWMIDSDGRVTATGDAALVAPTWSCEPDGDTFGSDASGWSFGVVEYAEGQRIVSDEFRSVYFNRTETRVVTVETLGSKGPL